MIDDIEERVIKSERYRRFTLGERLNDWQIIKEKYILTTFFYLIQMLSRNRKYFWLLLKKCLEKNWTGTDAAHACCLAKTNTFQQSFSAVQNLLFNGTWRASISPYSCVATAGWNLIGCCKSQLVTSAIHYMLLAPELGHGASSLRREAKTFVSTGTSSSTFRRTPRHSQMTRSSLGVSSYFDTPKAPGHSFQIHVPPGSSDVEKQRLCSKFWPTFFSFWPIPSICEHSWG